MCNRDQPKTASDNIHVFCAGHKRAKHFDRVEFKTLAASTVNKVKSAKDPGHALDAVDLPSKRHVQNTQVNQITI